MTSLTRFESQDGLELVIDIQTGEAFATVTGYATMSEKAKSTISERLQGVRYSEIKTSEILTPGGLQGVRLIPAELVFEWLMRDKPELAFAMGKAGATVYLHHLAGYKISSKVVETKNIEQNNYLESLKKLIWLEEQKQELEKQRQKIFNDFLSSERISIEKINLVEQKQEIIDLTELEIIDLTELEISLLGESLRLKDLAERLGKRLNHSQFQRLGIKMSRLVKEGLIKPSTKFGSRRTYIVDAKIIQVVKNFIKNNCF